MRLPAPALIEAVARTEWASIRPRSRRKARGEDHARVVAPVETALSKGQTW